MFMEHLVKYPSKERAEDFVRLSIVDLVPLDFARRDELVANLSGTVESLGRLYTNMRALSNEVQRTSSVLGILSSALVSQYRLAEFDELVPIKQPAEELMSAQLDENGQDRYRYALIDTPMSIANGQVSWSRLALALGEKYSKPAA
jgi:hypothetical protein